MGKQKKIKKDKELNDNVDFQKVENLLNSAINDISGYITLLDTKVSIIMASLGVIIAAVISSIDAIVYVYNLIKKNCMVNIFYNVVAIFCIISIFLVFYWGIQTIKPHYCNIDFKSIWFIKENKDKYSFETYRNEIRNMSTMDVIDTYSAELYKLNDIYKQKAKTTKYTIWAFSGVLILFAIVMSCMVFIGFREGVL